MSDESKRVSKLFLLAMRAPALGLLLLGIMYGSFVLVSNKSSLGALAGLLIGIGGLGTIIAPLICRRFPNRQSLLCNYAIALTALIFSWSLLELAVSAYWRYSWKGTDFFLAEGEHTRFDPIRGTFLTQNPGRHTRISEGRFEYVGIARGNAQGFSDRDDFSPKSQIKGLQRIAVFGDSFTAGFHGYLNWPDRVEDLAGGKGSVEFLNFGVNGMGLGNWWSILMRFVEPENYEFDGLIFAVYDDDLDRRFTMSALGLELGGLLSQSVNWQPISLSSGGGGWDLRWRLENSAIVSSLEFDQALRGQWPRQIPRPQMEPVLFSRLLANVAKLGKGNRPRKPRTAWMGFDSDQERLILDMAAFVKARNLPTLVVYIPSRNQLLGEDSTARLMQVKKFSTMLNAGFCDSTQVFQSSNGDQVRSYFFKYDAHWNAIGAERFSRFMLDVLRGQACPTWAKSLRSPD